MNLRSLFLLFLSVLSVAVCYAEEKRARSLLEDLLTLPVGTVQEIEKGLEGSIFSLGEIKVSSARVSSLHTDETATDLARNISVIGPAEMAESGSRDLPSLLSREEGVTYSDELGFGQNARIDLRGFGGEAKNVLVIFDGVRAVEPFDNSVTWHLYPAEFLERVEIQRGGGSTVFGEGAFSGVIHLRTKEPTEALAIKTENSYGFFNTSRNFVEVSGTASGFGFYAGAYSLDTEGYRDNGFLEAPSAILKGTYEWTDRVRLENSFYGADHVTGIPGPLLAPEVAADRRQKDPDGQFGDRFHDELLQDSFQVNWWLEPLGVELSNLAGWRRRVQDSDQSFGGSFPGTSINRIDTLTFSDVLQGTWSWERGPLESRFTTGAEFSKDDIHNPFTFDDKTFGPFSSERAIDRRMAGVFAQHHGELWDKFILESGVRWDKIDWDIHDLKSPDLEKHKKAEHLSPKIGAEFKPWETAALYGSFAESFKVPDSNTLIFETPNLFTPTPDIDPQVARHYEFGARYAHPSFGSLRAAYFFIETKKEILFNDITNLNENFDTFRDGVELAAEAKVTPALQLFANYTYTDAEFDNGAFDDRQIPLTPEHRAAAGAAWAITQHWTISVQATLVEGQFALNDFNNRFPADDYLTVDGKLAWKKGDWEFFARGQNLLGEEYSTFVSSNGVDTVNFNPSPELYLEAGFRYNYG